MPSPSAPASRCLLAAPSESFILGCSLSLDVNNFEVFIEFVTILLLFYVLVFLARRHVGS